MGCQGSLQGIWTVARGKIMTVDNLRKRKFMIIDWCCMCNNSGESTSPPLLSGNRYLVVCVYIIWGI